MLTFCKACFMKVGQIRSLMIWDFVVKIQTFVIFPDYQDLSLVVSYKASLLKWILFESILDVDFNVQTWSDCIGFKLKFFNPIFKPISELLARAIMMFIVAFFFNMAKTQTVKAEVSGVFLLIFEFRWAFHEPSLLALALSVQVSDLIQYEIKSRFSFNFFGLLFYATIV